ncbi:MAG: hypothetical protein ACRD2Z_09405 [Thermoanaerobaculia bacterium]
MSNNPITTARVGKVVYDIRHWKLTLLVLVVFFLGRFLSGRRLVRGGRSTDAKFWRGARRVHGSWWASLPGVARVGLRLAVVGLVPLWVYAGWQWLIVAGVVVVAGVVWVGVRQIREERHLDAHVRPVWPAVAGIIGVPVEDNPSAWLEVPADLDAEGAQITVGLRAAATDDEKRVAHLVTLFSQRLDRRMSAKVDYAGRVVHLAPRPAEPVIWPAVADILGVPVADLAADWLTVPAGVQDKADLKAEIVVRLPDDVIDDEPITESLKVLVNQRFAGEWLVKTDRQARRATLRRKPPEAVPPRLVDFLKQYPVPLIPSARTNGAEPSHLERS